MTFVYARPERHYGVAEKGTFKASALSVEERELVARRCEEVSRWARERRMPTVARERQALADRIRAGAATVGAILLRDAGVGPRAASEEPE